MILFFLKEYAHFTALIGVAIKVQMIGTGDHHSLTLHTDIIVGQRQAMGEIVNTFRRANNIRLSRWHKDRQMLDVLIGGGIQFLTNFLHHGIIVNDTLTIQYLQVKKLKIAVYKIIYQHLQST